MVDLDWRPAPGPNRVEAPNGAGKTSLLEAIYLASTGRSFRAAELAELRSRDAPPEVPTGVVAEVERDGLWELGVELQESGPARTLQGKPASLAEQLARLPLVVWSEAERELVRGADALRRRFFDRALLLLEPSTLVEESEHARAWRQKRRLLATATVSAAELAAWNELLAPHLARRAGQRERLAAELARIANRRLVELGAGVGEIAIAYRPSPAAALAGASETLAALAEREADERSRGAPLVGPQRDRIELALGAHGARRFASGGEQKLVALALLAALEELLRERGRPPVVLLDDLESELDPVRAELAGALFASAEQVVSTSSREAVGGKAAGVRWRLDGGAIKAL